MKSNDLDYFLDDEGMQTECVIDEFGENDVTLIYLESENIDEYFYKSIDYLFNHIEKVKEVSDQAIKKYLFEKLGNVSEEPYQLMGVYFFPGESLGNFGLEIRHNSDIEHGIGIYFNNMEVKKIGFGEVAFMG